MSKPRKKRGVPEPLVFVDEPRQPWDRQPKETDRAWECFLVYRELPYRRKIEGDDKSGPKPRSQREVSAALYPGKAPTSGRVKEIGYWSVQWHWVDRCAAYDAHIDKLRQDEFVKLLRNDAELNVALLRAMRRKAAAGVHSLPAEAMTGAEIVRMADVAITGLRREAGLATEITGTDDSAAFAAWLTGGEDPDEGAPDANDLPQRPEPEHEARAGADAGARTV